MTATATKILHDKLQASYDRSKMAETQHNYFPALEEFCEMLCESDNTTLKDSINEISAIGHREQERPIQLQKKCSNDTKTCMSKIMTYAKKNKITMPSLLGCFQEYEDLKEKRIVTSKEEPYDQFQITYRALEILAEDTSKDHGIFLKKFISIDKNKNIEFIFAPDITTWDEEKKYLGRSQKHKVWYSLWKLVRFHELYDFKTRKATNEQFKKNKSFFGSLSFYDDAQNLDQALEKNTGYLNIEEYKIHQNRVWEFIKPHLLAGATDKPHNTMTIDNKLEPGTISDPEHIEYTYDDKNGFRKGTFIIGQEKAEPIGNTAGLIYLLCKNKKGIHPDEMGSEAIDSQSETLPKEQAKNARRTANDLLSKKCKTHIREDFILSKHGLPYINPIYASRITLKKL